MAPAIVHVCVHECRVRMVKTCTHGQVWTFLRPLCVSRLCRQRLWEELKDLLHWRHGCFFRICNIMWNTGSLNENHVTSAGSNQISKHCTSQWAYYSSSSSSNFRASQRDWWLTFPCSCFMWATNTSLEVKRLLHSPHVYPAPEAFLCSELIFFSGEDSFFSLVSWPLSWPPSLLLKLLQFELVSLVLSGRLLPRFGGPSVALSVPWMAWKESRQVD